MRLPDGMLRSFSAGPLDRLEGPGGAGRGDRALVPTRRVLRAGRLGSGPAAILRELERQAESLGIADRVRIIGQVEDMPAALMLSDVVVHASTEAEAFGRVVIEAQAMGRPVIATDLGGPSRDRASTA